MNVLIFAGMYAPVRGGYFESIHGLASRMVARGHHVVLITCNTEQSPETECLDGVNIQRLDCWNPRALNRTFPIPVPTRRTMRILRTLMKAPWDIVSTQTRFFPTTWLGFFLAKVRCIPIVHTERGSTHSVAASSALVTLCARIVDHTLGMIAVRYTAKSIGVSNATCSFLRHLGSKNTQTIYNGIDADFWSSPGDTSREHAYMNITFVGRLIYGKGVQDLLNALVLLKAHDESLFANIRVTLVGEGAYRHVLEAQAREANLTSVVKFLGEQDRLGVRETLKTTDIFVNPSYSEGLPRSVLEAAASGCAIIATDTGGTREIIDDDRGILVQPRNIKHLADALHDLLTNTAKRNAMAIAAQRSVTNHFDWDSIVDQYLNCFSAAMQK